MVFINKEEYLKQKEQKYVNKEALIQEVVRQKAKILLARKDFKTFIEYVIPNFKFSSFNLNLISKLQLCYEWKLNRLIVNMPPRHWKTFITSTLFPLWVLWNSPWEEFMLTSYWVSLSSEIIKWMRPIFTSKKFKNVFPDFNILTDNEEQLVIDNKENKNWLFWNWKVLATWFSSPMTWKWFTYWIIDDPVKNKKESQSEKVKETIINSFKNDFLTRKQISKKNQLYFSK